MAELQASTDGNQTVVRWETCSLATVRRVAAMLDQDPDQWSEGAVLPRGWQFILLGADTQRSALRQDGFPGLGVSLPDLGLPRLMLGGRTVQYAGDVHIGETLRRESRIEKLSRKDTSNGPIAIVTIDHALHSAGSSDLVFREAQTYILMGAQPASKKAGAPAEPGSNTATKRLVPDDTLLFQYSALGFNSHKIHLDRNYARNVEGFPDLVVNGGLVTLLLTEFLRAELNSTFVSLTARHVAPLFCGRPLLLGANQEEDGWRLRAFDEAGFLAAEIEAKI